MLRWPACTRSFTVLAAATPSRRWEPETAPLVSLAIAFPAATAACVPFFAAAAASGSTSWIEASIAAST